MVGDRRVERLDELAAIIMPLRAAHDRLARLDARQVDPDPLADRLPRKAEHAKAARRQVEQVGVERVLARLAKARAAVDRGPAIPAGIGARGLADGGVATRHGSFIPQSWTRFLPTGLTTDGYRKVKADRKSTRLNSSH